jgi:hypothetical protein
MSKPSAAQQLKQAMRATFLAPNGQMSDAQARVMAALAQQTAAGRSPVVFGKDGNVDAHATLIAVGRQEVWHWLNQMLGIPDADVVKLAARDLREQ